MMVTEIGERIRVGAVFREEGQKIEPRWFFWKGKKTTVKQVSYMWREREGKELICRFAVTDGCTLYELSYWQDKLLWVLDAVETDG